MAADDVIMTEEAQAPSPLDLETILEEYRHRQMIEHLTGPVISVIVHLMILTVCFFFITSTPTKRIDDVEVTIEELKIKELDQKVIKELEKIEQRVEDVVPTVERPDLPQDVVADEVSSPDNFSDNMAGTDAQVDISGILDIKPTATPLKLSSLFAGRTNEGRSKLLRTGGGTAVTEATVLRSLRWLMERQNADGSWSQTQQVAMTGLALLTFLAHGESTTSKECGATVEKAMKYLTDRMNAASGFLGDAGGGQSGLYAHGIATYALSEAYGMTKIPSLKPAMEKGLKIIIAGQQSRGGWDYGFAKEARWDLSVSGWQIQALKAGFIAGADVPNLLEAIEKSINFAKKVAYANGRFGYSSAGQGSWGMTGVGTLCLQLLGEGNSTEAKSGSKSINEDCPPINWNDPNRATPGFDTYGWYYLTQAMFHAGQSYWRKWNAQFSTEFLQNQKPDGHWEPPPSKKPATTEYDPIMNTCFCALSLQVYYRYLPTYKMPKAVTTTSTALDLDDKGSGGDDSGLRIE